MAERWVLIDASALIYRAFHALPAQLRTASGLPTNAVYGFALMFSKILAGRAPDRGAVVFDAPGPTFRAERYPEYKAQRPRMPEELRAQLPWIDALVAAHDFPALRVDGFEADDVIGTLTRRALEGGHEVHIIAPDKDFLQLVGPRVRMIDTMRDITYDEEVVRKRWGVAPARFVDLLALLGDKVDNIPGVPGIGQKGATRLLADHGDLDGILAHLEALDGRARRALETHRDSALLSRELATIDQNVPLTISDEALRVPPVDTARINDLYRELEFWSLLDRESAQPSDDDGLGHETLQTTAALEAWLAGEGPVAVYPLVDTPGPICGAWVGTALARAGEATRYLPATVGPQSLGSWLSSEAPKLFHDVRDAFTLWARQGVVLRGVAGDTALASFLVDPSGIIPHRLDQVAKRYLHRALSPSKELLGGGAATRSWAEVDLDAAAAWAGQRAASIAEAWPLVQTQLAEAGQRAQLFERDIPLARVLADMQLAGVLVDHEDLQRMGVELVALRDEVEQRVHALAGRAFNLGSPRQLGEVLFDELALPVQKRTKTGYSTDQEVLERLAPKHEIARELLRHRELSKLIHTYTEVLTRAVRPDTGRIHCTFLQTTGVSGRLITTDPDLQRTPVRTDEGKRIRAAFIAPAGHQLISADWSQIELRVLAHVSGDAELRAAFAAGLDVHRRTAAAIYGVAAEEVTPAQRDVGKTVNFATIYGQGATALGKRLGISRSEAKRLIDRYFEQYAGVRRWLDDVVRVASEAGYVETLLGRRRQVPELTSGDSATRAYGERIATNTPIQGSAADLCKLAMLQIAERLEGTGARMLLQIHDELLFEVPDAEVDGCVATVRERMERCYPLEVPLVVSVGVGPSWAAAKT